jgi:hypothetical protein
VEVQPHFVNPRTKRDNLFLIYHLPKNALFQTLSWVALSHSPSASEKDSGRYPVDKMKDLVHFTQACEALRWGCRSCRLGPTFGTRPSRSCFWSVWEDKLVTMFFCPRANLHPRAQDSAQAVREDENKDNLFLGTPLPALNQVPIIHNECIRFCYALGK